MQNVQASQRDIMRTLEEIPTSAYVGFAAGSILLSAFFYLIGRRTTALFVGQWAPTFGIMALVYKLLHPSREEAIREMGEVGEHVSRTAREAGSKAGSR